MPNTSTGATGGEAAEQVGADIRPRRRRLVDDHRGPGQLAGVAGARVDDAVLDDGGRRPAVVPEQLVEVGDVHERDVGPVGQRVPLGARRVVRGVVLQVDRRQVAPGPAAQPLLAQLAARRAAAARPRRRPASRSCGRRQLDRPRPASPRSGPGPGRPGRGRAAPAPGSRGRPGRTRSSRCRARARAGSSSRPPAGPAARPAARRRAALHGGRCHVAQARMPGHRADRRPGVRGTARPGRRAAPPARRTAPTRGRHDRGEQRHDRGADRRGQVGRPGVAHHHRLRRRPAAGPARPGPARRPGRRTDPSDADRRTLTVRAAGHDAGGRARARRPTGHHHPLASARQQPDGLGPPLGGSRSGPAPRRPDARPRSGLRHRPARSTPGRAAGPASRPSSPGRQLEAGRAGRCAASASGSGSSAGSGSRRSSSDPG